MKRHGTFVLIAMILAMLVNLAPAPQAVNALSPGVVISQVYSGGGNTGATYTHDFVELFNRGYSPVALAGWSIQYTSATGTGNFGSSAAGITELPDVTLLPGQYFLIQAAQGSGGTTALPTPDVIDATPIAMASTGGKVALVNTTASLGCNGSSTPCSSVQLALIIDLVGWGLANFYETAPAPATTNPTAVIRNNNGCMETDNNSADFSVDTPTPRNTASLVTVCAPAKPVINEFSASTTGDDVEYVEIFGSPNSDYSAYTVLGIGGDAGSNIGRIDNVISLGTTDAKGLYLVNLPVDTLANGTFTFLLVKDFSNILGYDLDPNDDGDLDVSPWTEIADTVAVSDADAGDITYGMVTLTPNYDGLSALAPGGASRIPDGYNTNTNTDWVRNDFDLAGIPGYPGTPIVGEALNTPGAPNQIYVYIPEVAPFVTDTTPTDSAIDIAIDAAIEITFSEPVTVIDPWFGISCTISGAHTATVTDSDPFYALTPDSVFANSETCTVIIYATQVTDDDTNDGPDFMEADYSFTFSTVAPPEACGDPYTAIYMIQGNGLTSPLASTEVALEGVVVGDFQNNTSVDNGNLNGFHVQDPTGDGDPTTSDGLFIYYSSNATDVVAGDGVRVRGTVSEFNGMTQVTVSNLWLCSSGNSVSATPIQLPVTSVAEFEKYEGMLVAFPQELVISEYFNFDRYGEIVLTSRRHTTPTAEFEPGSPEYLQAVQDYLLDKITLDDGRSVQNPDPAIHPNGQVFDMDNLFRGGDTVANVTGVMDYSFNLYRIQPTQGADYTPANPRSAAPSLEGDLQVASFNVLNYFFTIDSGAYICGPSGDMECRGADTLVELERQRAKILAALSGMNADVYGLIEIQNDEDQSVADLVSGLNDIFGAGTYNYIATGYIGTDAIKQAIIYKTASVTPAGAFAILNETVDARFLDDYNRPVLAQSFTDNLTGSTFTVAVNHLKSKGSDCIVVGDPDLGDGQGNCNLTRTAAAEALVDWLATDPTASGASESLIIGDLNSYDKENPIDAILEGPDDTLGTGDDYTDLIFDFLGEYAYGYVFDGQTGYLDHALADPTLADNVVGVTIWHINADEPDLIDYNMEFKANAQDLLFATDAYRSSDHDPVIVSLSLDTPYLAEDDTFAIPLDALLIVDAPGVISNDSQANPGDSLSVQLKLAPDKGTLNLNSDGSFTYSPESGFSGWVTFVYELVSSVNGVVGEATVTITIIVEDIIYLPFIWTP